MVTWDILLVDGQKVGLEREERKELRNTGRVVLFTGLFMCETTNPITHTNFICVNCLNYEQYSHFAFMQLTR